MTIHESRPIALVGLAGAGKSAVARELGERLGTIVADLDAMIEAEEGSTVAGLFARSGESWFRRRESEILEGAIRAGVGVIACGGGIVVEPASRKRLADACRVVWLEVSPAEAARRVEHEAGKRPLLAGDAKAALERLLAERANHYEAIAEIRIQTDGRTVTDVTDQIERALAGQVS